MKINIYGFALLTGLAFAGCNISGERINGNGRVTSENRNVSPAEKITSLGDMDVFITTGDPGVKVEAEDNILPYIITESDGSRLTIRTKNNVNLYTTSSIKVYVSTPHIASLEAAGSGNITCNNKFSSNNDMTFKIAGSGDITVDVNAPAIHTQIAGSGDMHAKGETRNLDIQIAGSGSFDGPELKAENAEVSIAGSGDANLYADANLKGSVIGSGNIKYSGNATVDKHIVGSGSVTKVH